MADVEGEAALKARALTLVLDAWDQGLNEGVEAEVLASVCIFSALADMVDRFGAENVASFCETLPGRVRDGEFTLKADDAAG